MTNRGPAFYDVEEVFATYAAMRQRPDNANNTLEKPIFDALLGDVGGLRVLDLGCGDAGFGRELLAKGAAAYVGIEGSAKMFAQAQQILVGTRGEVIHCSMESWHYPTDSFDCVAARLAFHYIDDLATLFAKAHGALVTGGRLIFSVEHPVITSCNAARPEGNGKRAGWLVDDYFVSGPRVVKWMNGEVVKHHRTVEEYFLLLQQAGFAVEALRESSPQREYFPDEAEYQRRQRIPLLLFVSGRKG